MPSIREGAAELQFSTVISPKDHMWNAGSQWYYDVSKLRSIASGPLLPPHVSNRRQSSTCHPATGEYVEC